ncbi:MAG: ABC transporter permease [Christensenellales bacterium]
MAFLDFIQRAIRFSSIYMFGATGEILTEKSGHLNLGTPGIMCIGAVGGVLGESLYLRSLSDISQINGFLAVIIPILMTILFAGLTGLLFSFFTVTLRCNQNVTGLTVTTFGVGVNMFFMTRIEKANFNVAADFFRQGFPCASKLGWFGNLFLSHGTLVYLAIIVSIIVAVVIRKTRIGLNLRAVSENPATADAAGISVTKYRYIATIIGAAISGMGGLFFIMDYLGGNVEYQIEAFGWVAVALVIFSVWRSDLGILGSILFGALYILPERLVTFGAMVSFAQKELIKLVPYLVTLVVLIVSSIINKRESQPPQSLGVNYFREER